MNTMRYRRAPLCVLASGLALWAALSPALSTAADAAGKDEAEHARIEARLQAAQQRLEQAAREVAELSMSMGAERGAAGERHIVTRRAASRVMLGIAIDTDDDDKRGEGVRVLSVSPGGAAEAAGLRANDVITALGGKPLKGDGKDTPQRQMLAVIRGAKAGEKLAIEYRRDGKVVKTDIVPKEVSASMTDFDMPDIDIPGIIASATAPVQRMFRSQRRIDTGFESAELVELSPTLGSYFGTDKGLLVVRAPQDGRFKLQDGDVLLDIDGRTPTGVSHALQILDSYRAGETAKLHVMRQKKRIELAVTLPADEAPSRATPAPPSPPAPPGAGLPLPSPAPPSLPSPPEPPAQPSAAG